MCSIITLVLFCYLGHVILCICVYLFHIGLFKCLWQKKSDYFTHDTFRNQAIKVCICTIIGVTDHASTLCLSLSGYFLIFYLTTLYSIPHYSATHCRLNLYLYVFIGYLRGCILGSLCEVDVTLELREQYMKKLDHFLDTIIALLMQKKLLYSLISNWTGTL